MLQIFYEYVAGSRLWALVTKETREILHNKYLLFLILVPPTVQLLILGGALDPQVRNISIAIVDHADTCLSREIEALISNCGWFNLCKTKANEQSVCRALERGELTVGVIIPESFKKNVYSPKAADIQVLVDGVDAYTAGIAGNYILYTLYQLQKEVSKQGKMAELLPAQPDSCKISSLPIETDIQILYNPEQVSSWYFVPGILGACLTLTGTLVASAAVLRERERGTIEQLLMTPASSWEIVVAKIIPLVLFLLGDVCLAVLFAGLIFKLPVRGNFILLLIASVFYASVSIGLGILLGSLCKYQRQAQLASFFINIPLIMLSGTVVPLDTMPRLFQLCSTVNPLRYYSVIARALLLKGSTLEVLWEPLCVLAFAALGTLLFSIYRFKRQLV